MAVLVALIRGLVRHSARTIGNFWVDLVRSTLYILLPLVVRPRAGARVAGGRADLPALPAGHVGAAAHGRDGKRVTEQTLPMGPVASQIAIKQLGTNGGGFFNVNSAHPYENPTPLSNFFEVLAILLIPGRAVLHLRRDGRRPPPGLGDPGGDVSHLRAVDHRLHGRGASRKPCVARLGRRSAGLGGAIGRQHGRQGSRASASSTPPSGPPRRRRRPTAASIRCTIPSRRSAAWCRCG